MLVAAVVVTGCSGLHRKQVQFNRSADCPTDAAASLGDGPDRGGASIPTRALECALEELRASATEPRAARLGSQLCLLLAARQADPLKREQLASEGVRFAERALAAGGDGDGAVHYYLAVNLGLVARDHVTLAMDNLPRLERELQRAVVLAPGLDDGGPLRVLGMLYLKAPPWPAGIGDGDKALDLLARAVREHPDHPLNRLFYAQAIWDVEGEDAADRARAQYADGEALLEHGAWGYNRDPWRREFALVKEEINGSGH